MSRDLDLTDCRVLFLEADLCMAEARDLRPSSTRLCLEALRSGIHGVSIKRNHHKNVCSNLGHQCVFVCIRAEKMFGTKYFLQTQRVEPEPGGLLRWCGDIVTLAELLCGAMGRDSCERTGRDLSKQLVTAHNGWPGKPSCIIQPTMRPECLSWWRNSLQRDMRSTMGYFHFSCLELVIQIRK